MNISSDMRRGWCPGMLRPMPTGDGLLVRLHPRGGALTASQVRIISDASGRFGNGLLDISSRGNLQIRGVTEHSHPALVEALLCAGLTDGLRENGPYRLTLTSPLAGIDPTDRIDAQALAEKVEDTCADLGLPAKTCVVVDGGGILPLDDFGADLHLVAVDDTNLAVGLSGPTGLDWIGAVLAVDAPRIVRSILETFAMLVLDADGPARRLRDLSPASRRSLVDHLELSPPLQPPRPHPGPRAGVVALKESVAVLIALPFGRCHADTFSQVADWSETFGRGTVRLAPWRGFAVPHVSPQDAACVSKAAEDAGLIIDNDDARLGLSVCPGAPACTKSSTPTHQDADRIVEAAQELLASGVTLHVSGCQKGCAHSGPADLTLVGRQGAYEVVLGGTPSDKPCSRLTIEAITARLAQAHHTTDLIPLFKIPP